MVSKNFAIILGIQLIGAVTIFGVLLSDTLTEIATLVFLAITMIVLTLVTMGALSFLLKRDRKKSDATADNHDSIIHHGPKT